MVVAPASKVPVTFASPFTVNSRPPSNAPPPITAVERLEAPEVNVPVFVLPITDVLPLTVRFAFARLVPITVVPAFNVPVFVLPETSALPFTSSVRPAPAFVITTVASVALLLVNCAASPEPIF